MPECLWESIWLESAKQKASFILKNWFTKGTKLGKQEDTGEKGQEQTRKQELVSCKVTPRRQTQHEDGEVRGVTWTTNEQQNHTGHVRESDYQTLIHYGWNILNKRGWGASWDFLHCKRSKQRNRCDSNGAFLTSVHVTHTQLTRDTFCTNHRNQMLRHAAWELVHQGFCQCGQANLFPSELLMSH